jgi:hypothetical protein
MPRSDLPRIDFVAEGSEAVIKLEAFRSPALDITIGF